MVCGGKKNSYTSRKEAVRAKGWVGRKRGKDVRIYQCKVCHLWHLTSQKGLHIDDYT